MAEDTDDSRLPWFPCEPTPLLGALSAMKPDQQLVYTTVLLRMYEVGGPCPDGLDALSRRIGINKRRVTEALDALFKGEKLYREGAGIMNRKAREVLDDRAGRRMRASQSGKTGAQARWGKGKPDQRNGHSDRIGAASPPDGYLQGQLDISPPNGGLPPEPKVKRDPAGRKALLPADWQLSISDLEYAGEHGFDAAAAGRLALAFADHHRSRANRMADWAAAWRTWVRNEVKFNPPRGGPGGGAPAGGGPRRGSPSGHQTFSDMARERH